MSTVSVPVLGKVVPKKELQLGAYYAISEKDGYLLGMVASIDEMQIVVLLGRHNTWSSDPIPAWVDVEALSGVFFELPNAELHEAHASGTPIRSDNVVTPAGELGGKPKHGEIIEDDQKRRFLFIKQRLFSRAFLLGDGRSWPEFDPTIRFKRWRLLQDGKTLTEFETT